MASKTCPAGAHLQVDLISPEFHANPFPALTHHRTTAPVSRIPFPLGGEVWFVTRYEDALQVLKDPRFSVEPQRPGLKAANTDLPFMLLFNGSMVASDPPAHTRLRGLVSKAFTARFVEDLRPRIQEIADRLIDDVEGRGQMDLIDDFASILPVIVIAEMLGVPTEHHHAIRQWSKAIFDALAGDTSRACADKLQEFGVYTMNMFKRKRAEPRQDLISQLVQVEENGSRLSDEELVAMIALLIFAGHETTVNLIGNGMVALFTHPEELARLRQDPTLIPAAVEEILRFHGSVTGPGPRYATEDVELGGQLIKKGEVVLVSLAAANRDETAFERPEDFDIARAENKHITFGQGIHFCLGAPLARLEMQIALDTLLKRLPNLRLAVPPETLRWRGNPHTRGLLTLPVTF
jgi:cytochrome P450